MILLTLNSCSVPITRIYCYELISSISVALNATYILMNPKFISPAPTIPWGTSDIHRQMFITYSASVFICWTGTTNNALNWIVDLTSHTCSIFSVPYISKCHHYIPKTKIFFSHTANPVHSKSNWAYPFYI